MYLIFPYWQYTQQFVNQQVSSIMCGFFDEDVLCY